MSKEDYWELLRKEVIDEGLCTQCGTCVGLSKGKLRFEEKKGIPLPTLVEEKNSSDIEKSCYSGCPARYCSYPKLNRFVFKKEPKNWIPGITKASHIGYATDEKIRRNGASGGVITAMLVHLLQTKKITGVICLKMGAKVPYKAEPVVAKTEEEILACSQSIYSVTPVNTILEKSAKEKGPLAYVGLPDQVASIRKLQQQGHPSAANIKYVFGPYTGTQMYFEAIQSFLRSHSVKSEKEIVSLQYRAGEWPGYLQIKLKDGRVLKAEKFYYNYLIPFFITSSSLQVADFTNELTDISVGDAWSPKYESIKKGFSVVLARSEQGIELLREMEGKKSLSLEKISLKDALDMHGHMIDFKKRGSFIRNSWKKSSPDYGYQPQNIARSRIAVEFVLAAVFFTGKLRIARWVVEHLPLKIVGPCFNTLRLRWKNASKSTKRKGLWETKFIITEKKE